MYDPHQQQRPQRSPLPSASQTTLSSTITTSFPLYQGSDAFCTPWDGHDRPPNDDDPEGGPLLPPKGDRRPPPLRLDDPASFREHGLLGTPHYTPGFSPEQYALNSPRRRLTSSSQEARPQPAYAPRHPFLSDYEAPEYPPLIIFTILVFVAWPALYITTLAAKDKSLFWTRVIVGLGCAIVGISLGISLIELARRTLEAATWATVIHQSMYSSDQSGMTLSRFANRTNYNRAPWSALYLLWDRIKHQGTKRKNRRYDTRPWSVFLLFFIFTAILGASLAFIFGRIVTITTRDVRQRDRYREQIVIGDVTPADVARAAAQVPAIRDYVRTWTVSPFAASVDHPSPVAVQHGQDTIYFAETYTGQLWSGGKGPGTFLLNGTHSSSSRPPVSAEDDERAVDQFVTGGLVRFPRWGIRIHCEKLPDPARNIVPKSSSANMTYAFMPRTFLASLFNTLGLELPINYTAPLNATRLLEANDTLPEGINPNDIALAGKFWDNGVAQSFFSRAGSRGDDGKGWSYIEMIMVRINSSYTPAGSYGVYGAEGYNGTKIGFDAAVCVELVEPWLVESFNGTTGAPVTLGIVAQADTIDVDNKAHLVGERADAQRSLNSTNKWDAWELAHGNARNQVLKDNGRDFYYVPSPTLVSFTNGAGPEGYTTLSMPHLSEALALADAANLLPYLVGSAPTVAHVYPDKTLARAKVQALPCALLLFFVLVLGYAAAFLVPKLPLGVPRRDFTLFSFFAAIEGDQLLSHGMREGVRRNVELEEIEKRYGDLKVRYGI